MKEFTLSMAWRFDNEILASDGEDFGNKIDPYTPCNTIARTISSQSSQHMSPPREISIHCEHEGKNEEWEPERSKFAALVHKGDCPPAFVQFRSLGDIRWVPGNTLTLANNALVYLVERPLGATFQPWDENTDFATF